MLKALRLTLLCFVLAIAGPAQGETDRATAEMLLKKSGMWEQLGNVAPAFRASLASVMATSGAKLPASLLTDLLRATEAAYAAERLRSVCVAEVSQRIDGRHIPDLQRWYDTPLGQRISKLEEAASADTRDSLVAMKEDSALLEGVAESRRAMLDELVDAIGAAELALKLTANSIMAMRRGVASAFPDDAGPSASELKTMLDNERPRLLETLRKRATATFARMYEPLSAGELAQYVAFLKSPAGTHFNDVVGRAFDAALVEGATELGRRLPGRTERPST